MFSTERSLFHFCDIDRQTGWKKRDVLSHYLVLGARAFQFNAVWW